MLRRATGWAKGGWRFVRRLEPVVLAVSLGVVLTTLTFVGIAEELDDDDFGEFDSAVAAWVRAPGAAHPVGPEWLRGAARDVTALGSVTVLVGVVGTVALGLLVARRRRQAIFLALAGLTGLLVAGGLKAAYARARPETATGLDAFTSSFPSGHAFNSAVVYLTLGALLSRFIQRRGVHVYVFLVGFALTVAVGFTRVYLGYHHATDVLAGWAGGLGWALVCVLVAELLTRRGESELADRHPDPPR